MSVGNRFLSLLPHSTYASTQPDMPRTTIAILLYWIHTHLHVHLLRHLHHYFYLFCFFTAPLKSYVWSPWSLLQLPPCLPCPKSSSSLLSPSARKKCIHLNIKFFFIVYLTFLSRNYSELEILITVTLLTSKDSQWKVG